MPPAFAHEKQYTIDDIYALPDGKRAELIDGQLIILYGASKYQTPKNIILLTFGNWELYS